MTDSFLVGYNGFGCQLVVSNGAVLQDVVGCVGEFLTSNNVAVVTGPNTGWRTYYRWLRHGQPIDRQ